ncbi:MAG: inner membrane metabolite transport protein YhjE [SAR86 cluster bacterium SAR86A]|jgi:MFS family permease|uniref:Inner membrane metabolite transport protein YhjE n=1 Tax=SAR86 cluster bacterium SAR86A TaxID=1123866 RepID=J5KAL5_9GAMM|nr:MAG: inner membrane metabolite transport protein YhjE [SAR86 cluster bacterium SAR86A]|tara:strand:- start:376 stop:1686 length:1311 start_codon:yes stop_codon:yes gene_type:complete
MNQSTSVNQDKNMRKVALTALAGTSIEWYDFFLYGAAAALIFPTAFFGEVPETTALILSLLTFAAGFIARPIGGIIFGHFGDRVGRKKTLIAALMLMGISSTLIGLLPTYAMIGVTAPILLTLLRFAQGLAIGGQWGGAMLLVTESAPSNQRGYYGAFAQAGAPIGVILANLALIVTSALVSEEFFNTWGWRIPFLASAVLILISMYIQLNLEDTKAFKALATNSDNSSNEKVKSSPVVEAIRRYPKRIMLAAGAFLSVQVTFYILIAFMLAYGVSSANMERDDMLTAVLIGCAIMVPLQFMFSSYSDRNGRKGIFMLGAILSGIWAFAIFPLVDTGNFWLIVLALTFGLIFLAMMYGPQAAFFTELFSTEVRYSGATLGYQFGAIVGGAFAPTIAVKLWSDFDIFWVSVYIAFAAFLTLISVMALTETYQSNLDD